LPYDGWPEVDTADDLDPDPDRFQKIAPALAAKTSARPAAPATPTAADDPDDPPPF
jgi:hypothetical protein